MCQLSCKYQLHSGGFFTFSFKFSNGLWSVSDSFSFGTSRWFLSFILFAISSDLRCTIPETGADVLWGYIPSILHGTIQKTLNDHLLLDMYHQIILLILYHISLKHPLLIMTMQITRWLYIQLLWRYCT